MFAQWKLAHFALLFGTSFVIGLALLTMLQARIANYWPLGVDAYSHLAGVRAFWQGESPYAEAVTHEAEQLVYGRARHADEAPFPFTYPAYLALILLPITWIPASQVGIVWGAAMWAILATLILVWSLGLTPRPKPLLWGLLVLSGILFRPALVSIINGQYALFVVGCTFLAWLLITRKADAWVGIPLVLATIKPSVGMFLPIVLLIWALRWRRWKILASFILVLGVLMAATIFQIGWWLPDLAYHTLTYSALRQGIGLAWSAEQIATIPGITWLMLSLVVLIIGLLQMWRAESFPWLALIGALNLNLLLTPHSVEYDLTLLLIVLFWLGRQWQRTRWGLPLLILLFWAPWLSSLIVSMTGGLIELWWRGVWMFYPSLLLCVTLIWLAWLRKKSSVAARAAALDAVSTQSGNVQVTADL